MEFYIIRADNHFKQKQINSIDSFNIRICSKCNGTHAYLNEKLKVYFPVKNITDFYDVPPYNILSNNVYEILSENNITDFDLYQIDIECKYTDFEMANNKHKLCRFEPIGNGGFLHDLKGNVIPYCESCNRFLGGIGDGLSVNEDQWDGSDIFYFDNWFGNIIITEKVFNILNKKQLRNIRFINLKDFKSNYTLRKLKGEFR